MTDVAPQLDCTPQPVAAGERLAVIDILRGFAIFGILLENMLFFAGPIYQWQMVPPLWNDPADRIVVLIIRWLEEGKFYSLFAFLFGLGVALQTERVAGLGGRFMLLQLRRLLGLLVIGLGHAFLLWWGDILTTFAVLGTLLLAFIRRRNKTIVVWALILWFVPVALIGVGLGLIALTTLFPDGQTQWQQATATQQTQLAEAARENIANYSQGSLADVFAQRFDDLQRAWTGTALNLPGIFLMLLLGLYAGRRGFVQRPEEHARLYRHLLRWGLPLGLAVHLGSALVRSYDSAGAPVVVIGCDLFYIATVPLVTFGYIAAVVALVRRPVGQRWLKPLAAVGELSLTNYLLQTVICTTLFYSYGGGLYGRVGPLAGLAPTVLIFGGQVVLSNVWRRRFRFGPMEWMWRSMTYGRLQPMRRTA